MLIQQWAMWDARSQLKDEAKKLEDKSIEVGEDMRKEFQGKPGLDLEH